MNITGTPTDALRKTKAAAQILDHAASIGLPAPSQVSIFRDSTITLGVDSLVDLTDWALWMESEIVTRAVGRVGHTHKATGTALEQPIEVWTTTFLDSAVS